MENPQVVIKYISNGEKRYVGGLQQSSYSGYLSKRPFSDPNVQKFDLKTALSAVEKSPLKSAFTHFQILDNTGKVYYDNVSNIIKEEVQRFLNESYAFESDDFKFRQQITDSSFFNYDGFSTDFDSDILESNIIVNWSVGFWLNQSGIENYYIDVESVEGTYTLQLLNKQTDEVEQETEKNIAEVEWKFVIEDATLYLRKTLYVSTLEFDFKTNTCRVVFYDNENY
jgi:hypothetical protein